MGHLVFCQSELANQYWQNLRERIGNCTFYLHSDKGDQSSMSYANDLSRNRIYFLKSEFLTSQLNRFYELQHKCDKYPYCLLLRHLFSIFRESSHVSVIRISVSCSSQMFLLIPTSPSFPIFQQRGGITIPCTEEEAGNLAKTKMTGGGIISILQQSQRQYSWMSYRCSVHPSPQQYGRMLREASGQLQSAIDHYPCPIWYQLIGFLNSSLLSMDAPVNHWKHKVPCPLSRLFSLVKLNFNKTFKHTFRNLMVLIYDEFSWLYA